MQPQSFTLSELALLTQSKLVGDPQYHITNVADLDSASATDLSFLSNPRYEQAMQRSEAGAIIISTSQPLSTSRNFLISDNPSKAFQQVVEAFHGTTAEFSGFTGIHPTAVIHPSCLIGKNVSIGPYAVIDKNVKIGNGTSIGASCFVGPDTEIGEDCILHAGVKIRERCFIGSRVILQPGAVIGSCGFGYLTDKEGKHKKLNQVGTVHIGDDVEIGANTTIDRARFKSTHIRRGTKIDNLVQIAHGVEVGEDNIFAAQTGIAGSTKTGRCVTMGGQVAVAGHLELGDQVILAGRAAVSKSLKKPGVYAGYFAVSIQEHNRNSVLLRNIETYIDEIKELKKKLQTVEEKLQACKRIKRKAAKMQR